MTAPDPTAAFRDQLWTAIATVRDPDTRHPDDAAGLREPDADTDDIVDALEPVIRQVVAAATAAELDRLAEREHGRYRIAEAEANAAPAESLTAVEAWVRSECHDAMRAHLRNRAADLRAPASDDAPPVQTAERRGGAQ